jgi:hypothetical protein
MAREEGKFVHTMPKSHHKAWPSGVEFPRVDSPIPAAWHYGLDPMQPGYRIKTSAFFRSAVPVLRVGAKGERP